MDEAGTLCVACGFCCDGTLFKSVRVEGGEKPGLMARGFPVIVQVGGEVNFMQPCRALEVKAEPARAAHVCRHYEGRPQTCRLYRCKLLVALVDGEVDLAEALAEVDQARAEVARLGELLPWDDDVGVRSVASRGRALAASGVAMEPALAEAQRAVEARLDRRFRRPGR